MTNDNLIRKARELANKAKAGNLPPLQAEGDETNERRRYLDRERIIKLILDTGCKFWRDPEGTAYVTISTAERLERYKVDSRFFRLQIRGFYSRHGGGQESSGALTPGVVSDATMEDVVRTLEAYALQSDDVRVPSVRVGGNEREIWLDLGDQTWRLVRITAEGWKVEDAADAPLIRPTGLRSLPVPGHGSGKYSPRTHEGRDRLMQLFNLPSERDLQIVFSWLVGALWPTGPYTILAIDGEQGSGKSTTARMLRRLVDPNRADLRAMPHNEDDLIIAATNSRVVGVDNVSHIDAEMADAFCRLATGAGLSKRRLYTDDEEHIVEVCRPVLLNGIPSLLARPDFADRALTITMPPIAETDRRPESEIWREFNEIAPEILAVLLDGLVLALRDAETLKLPRLPRMADFAKVACAAAPAFGWTPRDILKALEANRENVTDAVLSSDRLADLVLRIAHEGWSGTATDLLAKLNFLATQDLQRARDWPKDAIRLSGRLRRLAPALRRRGVRITLPETGGRACRIIELRVDPHHNGGGEAWNDTGNVGNVKDFFNVPLTH